MKIHIHVTTYVVLFMMLLSACAPIAPATQRLSDPTATPMPTALPASREAQVQSVEIQILETDPQQVSAVVHGNLTESCATLGETKVQYEANTFHLTVYAISPANVGCAQVITPFETTIPLDIRGLSPGTYTVVANGV